MKFGPKSSPEEFPLGEPPSLLWLLDLSEELVLELSELDLEEVSEWLGSFLLGILLSIFFSSVFSAFFSIGFSTGFFSSTFFSSTFFSILGSLLGFSSLGFSFYWVSIVLSPGLLEFCFAKKAMGTTSFLTNFSFSTSSVLMVAKRNNIAKCTIRDIRTYFFIVPPIHRNLILNYPHHFLLS